jgi:hypothetical protein
MLPRSKKSTLENSTRGSWLRLSSLDLARLLKGFLLSKVRKLSKETLKLSRENPWSLKIDYATEQKEPGKAVILPPERLWKGEAKCESLKGLGGIQRRAGQICFKVKGRVLGGAITDQLGYKCSASGPVDENGRIKAGVDATEKNFAAYTGVLSGNNGSGIWQDNECYGTWTATKRGD